MPAVSECNEESIRLVDLSGLPTEGSGLVEVCVNEHWSRVCHETWDRLEAAVVCREMGFPSTQPLPGTISLEGNCAISNRIARKLE